MLKDVANRHTTGRMGAHLNDCVVIADDNAELRQSLEFLIKAEDIEVHGADDGLVGLQMCRRLHPRVIILDLYMPHMSGTEVLEALREDQLLRYAYVIMLSGMVGDTAELASLTPGADLHLSKPVESEVLMRAIEKGRSSSKQRGGLLGRLERH